MRHKRILGAALIAILILFGDLASPPPTFAQVGHCGPINANETWSGAGTVHTVTCNVTVSSGVTLTIAAGAIVKFNPDTAIVVNGTLSIAGTIADSVYLTSIKDDSVGGDTNGDGGATTPAPGDWTRLELQDSSNDSTSLIDHAIIRYGGGNPGCRGEAYGAITLVSAAPTIRNTTITKSQFYGIYTNTSTPTLTCNDVYENSDYGLYNATTSTIVKAENQWWGSASGPKHATNPNGTGNRVSDGVDFVPWRTTRCASPPLRKVYLPMLLR